MVATKFGRRSLLQTLGLAAGGAMLPSLAPRGARAAAVAPKRYLWYYTYHGTLPQFWVPKSGGETDFVLNDLLSNLEPYRKDIVLLDGLDMKSHDNIDEVGNAHQQGQNHSVAGIKAFNADLAGGPSLDQLIAKANSGKTKFPSLEMAVAGNGTSFPSYHYIAHTGPAMKLASEGDPRKVWSRVFSGFTPPAGGGNTMPPPAPMTDNSKKRQRSILDYVMGEIGSVQPKLSAADKQKLDAHTSAVRDLENQLGLLETTGGTGGTGGNVGGAGSGCASLLQPSASNFNTIVDAHVAMATMAFACDLTRVASINIDELSDNVSGYPAGAFGSSDAHDLIHKTSPDNGGLRNDAGAVDVIRKYHKVYAAAFYKIVDALAKMPDVDGKRVLDNTVVLWGGEIALGSHDLHGCKWVLAGSAGGAIRTGRWVQCNHAPHQNLYVSLGQACGLDLTTFGNPATCTGKLSVL
jgi:hypothetical protein